MKSVRLPFLKDHHNHLSLYSILHGCLDLRNVQKKSEAIRLLGELPNDKVSVVLGWNSGYFKFSKDDLRALPGAIINDASLHGIALTAKAEEMLIDAYPEIVNNYQDPVWSENNGSKVFGLLADVGALTEKKIETFFTYLASVGVYYAEDMHPTSVRELDVIKKSKFRDRTGIWVSMDQLEQLSPQKKSNVNGIKIFTDGSIGAQTAAFSTPYVGGKLAAPIFSDDDLFKRLKDISRLDKAVAIHAIGDTAISQSIGVLEKLNNQGHSFPQVRMEHAQFIDEELAHRAKALNLILCMQPNFSEDTNWYKDRIEHSLLIRNNPFRMLIDKAGYVPGDDLIFGSDGMPHGCDEAIKQSLFPPCKEQALKIEEFEAGYCQGGEAFGYIDLLIDYENQGLAIKNITSL